VVDYRTKSLVGVETGCRREEANVAVPLRFSNEFSSLNTVHNRQLDIHLQTATYQSSDLDKIAQKAYQDKMESAGLPLFDSFLTVVCSLMFDLPFS
jgi:hypothetical protein